MEWSRCTKNTPRVPPGPPDLAPPPRPRPFYAHECKIRLGQEVAKLRENAAAMLETSRLEEASLRRLLETAAAEGRRLMKALEQAEAARDEALAAGRGAGGEAAGLRETLRKERREKDALERGAAAEIASKVAGGGGGAGGGAG